MWLCVCVKTSYTYRALSVTHTTHDTPLQQHHSLFARLGSIETFKFFGTRWLARRSFVRSPFAGLSSPRFLSGIYPGETVARPLSAPPNVFNRRIAPVEAPCDTFYSPANKHQKFEPAALYPLFSKGIIKYNYSSLAEYKIVAPIYLASPSRRLSRECDFVGSLLLLCWSPPRRIGRTGSSPQGGLFVCRHTVCVSACVCVHEVACVCVLRCVFVRALRPGFSSSCVHHNSPPSPNWIKRSPTKLNTTQRTLRIKLLLFHRNIVPRNPCGGSIAFPHQHFPGIENVFIVA